MICKQKETLRSVKSFMSQNALLAARLAAARKENNYTQEEIADFLNCGRATVTNYESGRRSPDYDTLIKLAKKYNVTTDYLLGLTGAETTDKDKRYICDYTGLSEKSVDVLHRYKNASICKKVFSPESSLDYNAFCEINKNDFKLRIEVDSEETVNNSFEFFKNWFYQGYLSEAEILFILDTMICKANKEFIAVLNGIRNYIRTDQLINTAADKNNLYDEMNEYQLFRISKYLKKAADLIADDYIAFRGGENGND